MVMNRVTIELWLWLGNELGERFESPSKMRSIREENVIEGTTIRGLIENLAKCYPAISKNVFNLKTQKFYNNVVVNYNDRITSPYEVYDTTLKDGDKITILPLYMGG